jgi:hypothetical protein
MVSDYYVQLTGKDCGGMKLDGWIKKELTEIGLRLDSVESRWLAVI